MSPTPSLTATFVPLLSPPLRVSLHTLRWLTRRPPSSLPCRSLSLYNTARAATVHGMHAILDFSRYDLLPPAQSPHAVNIVKQKLGEDGEDPSVLKGLSLKQLLANHIRPGRFLRLAAAVPRADACPNEHALKSRRTAAKHRDYVLVDAYSPASKPAVKRKSTAWALYVHGHDQLEDLQRRRDINLQLATPVKHFEDTINRAYQCIQIGCPVEFNICVRHCSANEAAKLFSEGDPVDSLDYVFDHFPHLRPDLIFKSMPEATCWVVHPFTNGRNVRFVLGNVFHGAHDLTDRILNVQTSVRRGIKEVKTLELPRKIKIALALQESSHDNELALASEDAGLHEPNRLHRLMVEADDQSAHLDRQGKLRKRKAPLSTVPRHYIPDTLPGDEPTFAASTQKSPPPPINPRSISDGGSDHSSKTSEKLMEQWKAWTMGGPNNHDRHHAESGREMRKRTFRERNLGMRDCEFAAREVRGRDHWGRSDSRRRC